MKKSVNILNKKARFTYDLLDSYVAGIVLTGTEIKSIRESKASIAESFCEFNLRAVSYTHLTLPTNREV